MNASTSDRTRAAISSILWNEWDPIGVNDGAGFDDEYDSYAKSLVNLIADGADSFKVAERLRQFRTVSMGLSRSETEDMRVAKLLVSHMNK